MSNSTKLARATICQLIELGVTQYVLSPGSRNAPLSIALYQAEQKGLVEVTVKIDERGAGFYALGLSKASGEYVAVVCTSGTAAANYYPAALEAYHSANKLLIITADRPARLRKTGANQTTDQVQMYKNITSHDLHEQLELSQILLGGPIHLNIQFDEPLLSDDQEDWLQGIRHLELPKSIRTPRKFSAAGNGLIVVGHDHGGIDYAELLPWIRDTGLPVIAEDPISVPMAQAHASLFLADESIRNFLQPDYVFIIGRTTLSRSTNALITATRSQYVIDPRMVKIDTERAATEKFLTLPELKIEGASADWNEKWITASARAASAINNEWSESEALRSVTSELPEGSALFVGSSRPIRDIEGFAAPRSGVSVFANRGLAGIDGNTSTVFGISQHFKHTYAVMGDITFLHDLSALVDAPTTNLTIFLIDNNGGGIFSTLPQAGVVGFEKIFGTPHNKNIESIVRGFGIEISRVKSSADIEREVIHPHQGVKVVIVEVPTRDEMASHLKEIYQRVSSAVRIGANLA